MYQSSAAGYYNRPILHLQIYSPWAERISWLDSYIAFYMIAYKPSKLGQTDLVFG